MKLNSSALGFLHWSSPSFKGPSFTPPCPATSGMPVSSTCYAKHNMLYGLRDASFLNILCKTFSLDLIFTHSGHAFLTQRAHRCVFPQKSHFPKVKHTTFLESRKGGSSSGTKGPFHFAAWSVSTPASLSALQVP